MCTDRGQRLANAFEASLGGPQTHRWLRDVTCLDATPAQMERSRPILSVLEPPTALERQAFEASFFPDDPRDSGEISDPHDEQRWCGLHLVIHTIEQLANGSEYTDEDAIRAAMTSGMTRSARSVRDVRSPAMESSTFWC